MSRVRSKQLNYPLFGSFSGSFTGSFSGLISGSIELLPISNSVGISPFYYDNANPVSISVSGAVDLVPYRVVKWSGDAFVNSTILDQGDSVIFEASRSITYGTASFYSQENIQAKSNFIILSSGSSYIKDSGIVIQTTNLLGSSLYLSRTGSYGRFAVAHSVNTLNSNPLADEYLMTVKISQIDPTSPPTWGGVDGIGNMWINSDSSSIFIWA